ncbi:acetyl-coenzyme A synthetase, partial [Nocardia abscessus]|uniref:acetyl-coenzyme A synthetase N-terminal domain-containing protein n=1 Tax=Nocardia abscessus TaxID=120957 RepID=UPI002B4B5C4B
MTSATTDDRDTTTAYPPDAEFAAQANADAALYDRARSDRLEFWAEQARRLHWEQPWTQVLDWSDAPVAKWFVGGKLNVAYNCVDRHVLDGHGDQIAIHW